MGEIESGMLKGRRVLVVEDESFLAEDICAALIAQGANIYGPANTIHKARQLVEDEQLDLAILDINVRGELVFSIASDLQSRGVPFVFTTGYDKSMIPEEYQSIERLEKPFTVYRLYDALNAMVVQSPDQMRQLY